MALSGLAAAWFYQRRFGAGKRILILDNHDDFGGHAKRNGVHCTRTETGDVRRQRRDAADRARQRAP
ncbi:NAD(P)-binding protein [Cupriavidus basilensis]